MKPYELAVLLHPDLEIDLEAPLKRLDDTLKKVKAKVVKRDEWGKRKLAYIINKQSFAVYVFYIIDLDPSQVGALDQALRLSDEVLRHLLISYEEPIPEPARDESRRKQSKEGRSGS